MRSKLAYLFGVLLLGAVPGAQGLTLDPGQVDAFIRYMVKEHQFDEQGLRTTFASAQGHDKILQIMARPAETKPWHEYRPIFMTRERITGGVAFWEQHEAVLRRAEERFGVPAEVIVAIIGVETFYGRNAGSYPVLEAVSTLAFHYPKRAEFFRGELEQFLLLVREERVDPLSLSGSYAGAMGMPQFIASSFRRYAIDFDEDGRRDIWTDPDDVIGSVANYLGEHGWQRDGLIAMQAVHKEGDVDALLALGLKPQRTVAELAGAGLGVAGFAQPSATAAVISLQQPAHRDYWLGFDNFYAITRYNHSPLYAMVVFQLAQEIRHVRLGDRQ